MQKLTTEQVAEAERRLRLPQAMRVVAHHMRVPLCQIIAVAHSLRERGRPMDVHGDSVDSLEGPV